MPSLVPLWNTSRTKITTVVNVVDFIMMIVLDKNGSSVLVSATHGSMRCVLKTVMSSILNATIVLNYFVFLISFAKVPILTLYCYLFIFVFIFVYHIVTYNYVSRSPKR